MLKLSPCEYAGFVFGSDREVCRALEVHESSVGRWKRPLWKGGRDGRIPDYHQQKLIIIARKRKLDFTTEDLIFGRTIKPPKV